MIVRLLSAEQIGDHVVKLQKLLRFQSTFVVSEFVVELLLPVRLEGIDVGLVRVAGMMLAPIAGPFGGEDENLPATVAFNVSQVRQVNASDRPFHLAVTRAISNTAESFSMALFVKPWSRKSAC